MKICVCQIIGPAAAECARPVLTRMRHAAAGTHKPYGITQCYLPPGRGDIPALTRARLVLDQATPKGYEAELT